MKNIVKNPILRGFHPDPCMIYVGETYYIATSTFEYFPGVEIQASKDLANFKTVSYPLNRISQLSMAGEEASCGVWAPDLSFYNGKFYLIYTNQKQWVDSHFKDTENYLVTAEKIEGPWSDPIYINSSGFDPSVFHDDDGRMYILNMRWDYRKENDGLRFTGIIIQEFDEKKGCLIGKSKKLFSGTFRKITEGPHLYKINGYYYLICAEGGTGLTHGATVARSKNLFGPYELHPNEQIITSFKTNAYLQKAGHASFVKGKNNQWMLAHLCARPLKDGRCCLGRETALQNVIWKDGWPYLENGTTIPSDTYVAFAEQENRLKNIYYLFDKEISQDFLTLREPKRNEVFSLTERLGYLAIKGGKSIKSNFGQSALLRRQESFEFECETKLDYAPDDINHLAGLLYRYSENNQHLLAVTYDDETNKKILAKISYDDGRFSYENIAELPINSTVILKLKVNKGIGLFLYSLDGIVFHNVGKQIDVSKLSDEYNRPLAFTGPFVGMTAIDMKDLSKKAYFEYFHYQELSD